MTEPTSHPLDRLTAFADAVPAYYLNAFRDFLAVGQCEGLRVLEIGGSALPPELVLDALGARQWVCVDVINHASGAFQQQQHAGHYAAMGVETLTEDSLLSDDPYLIFDGSAEALPRSFAGRFDVVFSINAFEHVLPLAEVIRNAHEALKPGGLLFSQFGPIWSCSMGSHFWVRPDFCFNDPGPMPPWAHLLLTRDQLRDVLSSRGVGADDLHHVLYQVYESSFVNRRFFEDYVELMRGSDFPSPTVERLWAQPVPADVQRKLEVAHPGRFEFGAYGIRIVARKRAGIAAADSAAAATAGHHDLDSTPINRAISLDDIVRDFPSFHRKADGSPWFLGISGDTLKAIAAHISPGMRTVETGAGFSTLAFIIQGAHHTAICPDDYLEKNIRDWCDERTIDHSRFTYVRAKSQDVVPALTGELDFAFVDGEHAFPMPMIDFYYLARMLKPGGLLAIDDVNIWTGDVIVKHLALDSDWEFVSEHDEKTCLFRLRAPFRDKGLWHQSFVLANSRHLPSEWCDAFRR